MGNTIVSSLVYLTFLAPELIMSKIYTIVAVGKIPESRKEQDLKA